MTALGLGLKQRFFSRCQIGTARAMFQNVFYNWSGRCTEMRAFSGSAWKTHVLDGASKIAEIRNCSESRWAASQPDGAAGFAPKADLQSAR
jgi:hypothetical protein